MEEGKYLRLAEQYLIPIGMDPSQFKFSGPVIDRAKGSRIYDLQGKAYLDFNAGQMGAALGHNHPLLIKAINRATDGILHCAKH